MQIQSSARTVGKALAEAGIPLIGLDYSLPAEKEPLPSDGQIKIVRLRPAPSKTARLDNVTASIAR